MKPTQFELSTLAATLITPERRTFAEAVELAGDLWDMAGKALSRPEPRPQVFAHLPLEDFLRQILPKLSVEKRKEKFRGFLRWQILGRFNPTNRIDVYRNTGDGGTAQVSVKATEKNILAPLNARMEYFCIEGIKDVLDTKFEFCAWRKHVLGQSRSKGTTAVWANGGRGGQRAKNKTAKE